MSPLVMIGVALAGGLGAACRYTLDMVVSHLWRGPMGLGTGVVNVTGAFALGLLVGLTATMPLTPETMLIVGGGFLGAYTTFSTWMYESLRLAERGAWHLAMLNIIGSVVAGVIAAAFGLALAGLAA